MRRGVPLALVALLLLGWAREAAAQLQFAGDAPQVYSIQPRQHRFLHELTLGVGFLPENAYYVGVVVSGGYTYHFNDLWCWEVVNGFYSFNFNTGLQGILATAGTAVDAAGTQRVIMMLSSNAVVKPLFGKIAVFNRASVQAESYLTAGLGIMQFSQANQANAFSLAPNAGLGMEYWASHRMAAKLDIRDYVAFTGAGVVNTLLIGVSASFNFYEPSAPEAPPRE